jgi:hypothetical protein
LTDQGHGQSQPDDASRADYRTAEQPQYSAQSAPGASPDPAVSPQLTDTKGFLASLFDFGFTSFVTTKIIKSLYALIVILLTLGMLGFVVFAFSVKTLFGLFVLIIVAPIFFFVYLAIWRIFLEILVVIFRIAEDLRAIRERSGLR